MDNFAISVWDLGIIILYFIGVILFSLYLSKKKIKDKDDYFLAGRGMKWPFIASSLFSTNISSQQFIGQSGFAFLGGIAVGTFQMMGALCFGLLAIFFIDTYRNLKIYTSPEFFERRYDGKTRKTISAINIIMIMLATVSVALYAGSIVILTLLGKSPEGMNLYMAIAILGIVTGAYTLMGGLKAVIYTDFIQNLLLIIGGVITLIVGISAVGGLPEVLNMPAASGESMWLIFHPFNHKFGWLPVATGVLILGIHGHCTDQDYVQRILAAKNAYHAKMGAVVAGFMKVLALFICAMPGVIAAKFFENAQGILPDQAYVSMMISVLPTGVLGLCLAGLIAAIMSSVDSGLCAASSLISFDFIKKDKNVVKLGRIIIGILIVFAIAWAPVITRFEAVFKYLMRLWAYFAPPVVVTVLFGLFHKKATSKAAFITIIAGVILGFASFFGLDYPKQQHGLTYFQNEFNVSFLITIFCSILMYTISRYGGRTKADKEKSATVTKARFYRDKQDALTPPQKVKFVMALAVLLILFVGMFALFSPAGLGKYKYDFNSDGYVNADDIQVLQKYVNEKKSLAALLIENKISEELIEKNIGIKKDDFDEEAWKEKYAKLDIKKDGEISKKDVKEFKNYKSNLWRIYAGMDLDKNKIISENDMKIFKDYLKKKE